MKERLPYVTDIVEINGIKLLSLHSAFTKCSTAMFERNAVDLSAAKALVQDASELLIMLLVGSHLEVAGAFRNIGQDRIADDLLKTMKAADYNAHETDPFQSKTPVALSFRGRSTYANSIKLMWEE
jgi:hypothetical protein